MSASPANWLYARQKARFSTACFEVSDCSTTIVDIAPLIGNTKVRDPYALAERRADSLLEQNRGLLRDYHVQGHVRRRQGRPELVLKTGTCVGAAPLLSPVTGKVDYGLVIRPRFQWSSVGVLLTQMGMKVVPQLVPLPELPRSERRIPVWILSSVVLSRLKALLDQMERGFVYVEKECRAPRGSVQWRTYASVQIPRGRPDIVPCRFPDLRDDEELFSAIHHTLRLQRTALNSQRSAGIIVLKLLELCEQLLRKVEWTPPQPPSKRLLASWNQRPLSTRPFTEGLQAIEWTIEERGLAGLSNLSGLPWRLEMERFFEAWVEAIVEHLARLCGGTVRSGRLEQTRTHLSWSPSFAGSQRSLLPDVVLDRGDVVVVFDAKYKHHLEELERTGWRQADDVLREHHREDLMQVLAYSTLFEAPRLVACLIYPCRRKTYESLLSRNRIFHHAKIMGPARKVELALAAAPMGYSVEHVARGLLPLIAGPA